jgi:DNA repair protein RecO (recombination protein O)
VNLWSDEAIVLGSRKSNESNRVVFLLTRGHGRIVAAANGVRKTKSRIGARLEPMNHVEVLVKPGRGLPVIDEVKLVSVHHRLHSDLARMSQGMAMLEAVDRITPDHEPVPEIFELLRRALATLDQQKSPLMLAAFYLKLLAVEGSAPQLGSCVGCGAAEDLVGFDIVQGGTQCGSCRMGAPFSAQALDVLRMILGGNLRAALDLGESPAVHEAHQMVMNMMEAHLERRIRSLGVFDRHL